MKDLLNIDRWTYGAEHEWGDWHYNGPLPEGYGRDMKDITCMSSNGIANDPKGKSYCYGGEINTPPYSSPLELTKGATDLVSFLGQHGPRPVVNHRSNLHIHIRVPGLKDELQMLKQVQKFIHQHMRYVLEYIQPLPRPTVESVHLDWIEHLKHLGTINRVMTNEGMAAMYEGALRRWKRRRVSHQTLLTSGRLENQLAADTIEDFFKREVPQSNGKPQWHLQPRLCVNMRQLLETDTIEFRHFAGTLSVTALWSAVAWCQFFMRCALENDDRTLYGELGKSKLRAKWTGFPNFPAYIHYLECRYRATVHDGTLNRHQIEDNIQRITAGAFDEYPVWKP